MDGEQRKGEFLKDWKLLLDKHEAEAEYDRENGRLTITMYTKYNQENGNEEKAFSEFDL